MLTKEMFLNIQVYSLHCTRANQTKMATGCSVGTHGNKGRQFLFGVTSRKELPGAA